MRIGEAGIEEGEDNDGVKNELRGNGLYQGWSSSLELS